MNQENIENGTEVWIYLNGHKGNLTKGKIVHQFDLGHQHLYVIEIDTPVDPIYEVRHWHTISLDGVSINLWKEVRKDFNAKK